MAVALQELKDTSALSELPEEQLAFLSQVMIKRTYSPGELIFLEGYPSSGIWFLIKGRVRILKRSLDGNTQGLCIARVGSCFGGCPLFDGAVSPASAQALDEVTLIILPREESYQVLRDDPRLAQAIMALFNERLAHLARLSEGLGAWSVSLRIRDCLNIYADWTKDPPVVSLTHKQIADLVGSAREVFSRHLSRLARDGLIGVEVGQIVLLDREALEYTQFCEDAPVSE